jgi:hypothetical protein
VFQLLWEDGPVVETEEELLSRLVADSHSWRVWALALDFAGGKDSLSEFTERSRQGICVEVLERLEADRQFALRACRRMRRRGHRAAAGAKAARGGRPGGGPLAAESCSSPGSADSIDGGDVASADRGGEWAAAVAVEHKESRRDQEEALLAAALASGSAESLAESLAPTAPATAAAASGEVREISAAAAPATACGEVTAVAAAPAAAAAAPAAASGEDVPLPLRGPREQRGARWGPFSLAPVVRSGIVVGYS